MRWAVSFFRQILVKRVCTPVVFSPKTHSTDWSALEELVSLNRSVRSRSAWARLRPALVNPEMAGVACLLDALSVTVALGGLLDVMGVELLVVLNALCLLHSRRLAAPNKIVSLLQTCRKISSTKIFISSFLFISTFATTTKDYGYR